MDTAPIKPEQKHSVLTHKPLMITSAAFSEMI
jgi:hypothetical protein